jgi:hypothetical protein
MCTPVVLQVAQVLFPALLVIVSRPEEYEASVRRRALQIVHDMGVVLASVQSSADKQSSKTIAALLDAWFQPFCAILAQPTKLHVRLPSPGLCTQAPCKWHRACRSCQACARESASAMVWLSVGVVTVPPLPRCC